MYFLDKMLEHFFSDLKIGDNPVLHRSDSGNIARRTTQHALRFDTHSLDNFLTLVMTDSYNGRLVQNNAFFANINQCICGAQIDRQII